MLQGRWTVCVFNHARHQYDGSGLQSLDACVVEYKCSLQELHASYLQREMVMAIVYINDNSV